MKFIEVKAPAKINIGLKILSKRSDAFHNLSTLFYPIHDLCDVLTFEFSDQFEFYCDSESVPKDNSNLVIKARNLISEITGKTINVKITLTKRIPVQAGLGGGSSDAAATLKSLNKLFRLELKHQHLINLALQLGSDVPFFIDASPSIGESRGEILHKINLRISEPILIVNPMINISTVEAFKNIFNYSTKPEYNSFIKNGKIDYPFFRKTVTNDFEEYVFRKYPQIENLKSLMYENGALFSLLSGSGSTVYGIFPNLESAIKSSEKIPQQYFVFITHKV